LEQERVLPWTEVSIMDQRAEFVALAQTKRTTIRGLSRRFGIAPTTAYKWLHRAEREGATGLANRSRRPHASPRQTAPAIEQAVLDLRAEHTTWGGRKLAARLRDRGLASVPSPSTVTAILRRHGQLAVPERAQHAWQRFEQAEPNQLWQLDFKGHVALGQGGGRLHPLTALDDHSRYCVVLGACGNERSDTVRDHLIAAFRRYGLPDRILTDNGSPWGFSGDQRWTRLGVWLLQVGVAVSHGRPYHPQTQGKEERFHRTLKAELLQGPPHATIGRAQQAFDGWRTVYNLERPHEACGLRPPVSRYRPSERSYPEVLPVVEYGPEFLVGRVRQHGALALNGRDYQLSEAFGNQPVGLLPTALEGVWTVYFSRFAVGSIDEHLHSHD
jgi:transposase InsO family protein